MRTRPQVALTDVTPSDLAAKLTAAVRRATERQLATLYVRVLAEALNLDYPVGARGWERAHYTDGRQHAGILTMSTTWLRYPSAGGNANRSRANAVSKMLLCDDYLSRPIVLNRAAVDQLTVDPETAISTNASCQSCHSTLDPLASHFFGFFVYDDEDPTEGGAATYRPERRRASRASTVLRAEQGASRALQRAVLERGGKDSGRGAAGSNKRTTALFNRPLQIKVY